LCKQGSPVKLGGMWIIEQDRVIGRAFAVRDLAVQKISD
jgi:hypothetical protein